MPITLPVTVRSWRSSADGGIVLSFDIPKSYKQRADQVTDLEGRQLFLTVYQEGELEDHT